MTRINQCSCRYTCFQDLWFSSVIQSCPTLCDPMDSSMPGLPVHHQHFWFMVLVNINTWTFFGGSDGKEFACNAEDLGSVPGLGRSPGEGNGNSLQYPCLGNLMDRGAWWAAVHGVTESWTRLSDLTFTFHFHALKKERQPTPVFLPGESQGWGSLVGCCLWGRTESDTTEAT